MDCQRAADSPAQGPSRGLQQRSDMGGSKTADFSFVQLDRTFHELSRQERDGDEFDFSEAYHVRGNLTWADLLKEYRTIILSEPGSGKTEEIRQAANCARRAKPHFFLGSNMCPAISTTLSRLAQSKSLRVS
jgi:hypothetical protein